MNDEKIKVDQHFELNTQQLEELMEADPHFISGGARRYFRRVWIGYALLAFAMVVGIWAFTARADKRLRSEINSLGVSGCVASIKTYEKFNDLVNTNIIAQQEAMRLNKSVGDFKRAAINKRSIKSLEKDLIIPPSIQDCQKPILK